MQYKNAYNETILNISIENTSLNKYQMYSALTKDVCCGCEDKFWSVWAFNNCFNKNAHNLEKRKTRKITRTYPLTGWGKYEVCILGIKHQFPDTFYMGHRIKGIALITGLLTTVLNNLFSSMQSSKFVRCVSPDYTNLI